MTRTSREGAPRHSTPHAISSISSTSPVSPNVGQRWCERATGEVGVLVGRTSTHWAIARVERPHEARMVTTEHLDAGFDYVDCDHDRACCTIHGTHTSPHRACILR